MNKVRFSPFEQMDSLRRQIDQVFADMESAAQNDYPNWSPPIELLDDTEHLILRTQLAGIDGKEDIDIQVTRESVTISGKRHRPESKSDRCLHSEFIYGKFQRKISLPVPVINSQATANSEAGILTLILPKVEKAKQRVVKIKLGDTISASSIPETESAAEAAAVASA